MPKLWLTLLIPFLAVSVSGTANAQEPGKLAAVIGASNSNLTGYGTAGALWQFSNRFAVRGDFSSNHSRTIYQNSYSNVYAVTTTRSVAVGVSGLITLHKQDNLRIYVSPRYARAFNKSIDNTKYSSFTGVTGTKVKPYSWSGAFGGQYNLSRRFGVFGESGLENVRTYTKDFPDNHTSDWRMLSTFGILLYFGKS